MALEARKMWIIVTTCSECITTLAHVEHTAREYDPAFDWHLVNIQVSLTISPTSWPDIFIFENTPKDPPKMKMIKIYKFSLESA